MTLSDMVASDSVFELVGETQHDEARRVMEIVRGFDEAGGSRSDVLIVTCDPSSYESPLTDAATRHGYSTTTWTQLPLTDTLPYLVVTSTCRLLAADAPTVDTLLAPLETGWIHPGQETTPIPASTCSRLRRDLLKYVSEHSERAVSSDDEYLIEMWWTVLEEVETPSEIDTYVEWLKRNRTDTLLSAPTIDETLTPLVNAYEETVVPHRWTRTESNRTEIAQTTRAVVRVRDLVKEVRSKYDEYVDNGYQRYGWQTVVELFERIGGLRPGRRDHPDAGAIDIVEANDTWGVSRPLVIVVGLTDGQWLTRTQSMLPRPLQVAVRDNGSEGALMSRAAWSVERSIDHFVDALSAATSALVCTRYRMDANGDEWSASPLLSRIETRRFNEEALMRLRTENALPPVLATAINNPNTEDGNDD